MPEPPMVAKGDEFSLVFLKSDSNLLETPFSKIRVHQPPRDESLLSHLAYTLVQYESSAQFSQILFVIRATRSVC